MAAFEQLGALRVAVLALGAAALLPLAADPAAAHGQGAAHAEDTSSHARSDAYWAELARGRPAVALPTAVPVTPADYAVLGRWGPVLPWPHVAGSAANLPDGRILTFASNQRDDFPFGPEFTYAAVFNPASGAIEEINHGSHDMFCGALVMLEDGRVFINGGRNTVELTSTFDFQNERWNLIQPMNRPRWYPTTVALPDGQVFTALGDGGGDIAEVWHPSTGWRELLGMSLASLMTGVGFEKNWFPFLQVDPSGRLFHHGPTENMHRIDPSGAGSIQNLGPWMASNRWYPKDGAVVMYNQGRILEAGGDADGLDGSGDTGSSRRSLSIDINGPTPLVSEIAPMAFRRRFANAVMLPGGEVLVVGGNSSGVKFSDQGTILTPELWDPDTGLWQQMADMSVPRNYHSVALLIPDGRVFSAGGGLCSCSADHADAQLYSPPYLFAADGSPAPRPAISAAPTAVRNGQSFAVQTTGSVVGFSLIKMSATTHATNTDLRFLRPAFASSGGGGFTLTAHPNRNVLIPGYWMLFALNAAGVPSVARILQVTGAGAPQVTNPGPQVSAEGDGVTLPIAASDPNGDPLGFSASGLPPGLSIHATSGVISGSVAEGAAGSYSVQVEVADAIGPSSVQFTWTIFPDGLGSGQILREWWTGISGSAVSQLTSAPGYPNAPSGSGFLSRFEAPTNWADNYGTRVRGYLHPPVTGSYRFWIASDDNSELWLSSDAMPAPASLVARVPGWTSSRIWDKYPEQQSAPIPLLAGQRYYVEALQKEGGGGDNLAVAWEVPGLPMAVIDGLYLSPLEFEPSVDPLADQFSLEGDSVSLQAQASDPNGDPLSFSALGLPPGVAIHPSSGMISGSIAVPAAGSYAVTVSASDPSGASGSSGFGWLVVPQAAQMVAPLNKGVACQEDATGSGYLMYSAQNVRQRFSPAPTSANSAHFVCVVLIGGQWHYDDNHAYHPFTPVATDALVAAVDFGADTAIDLVGQQGALNGIALGYQSGDLTFTPNWYDGAPNAGEFGVAGTYLVANPSVCGDALVGLGEDCDGTPCCTASCSFEAPGALCADGNVCSEFDACNGAGSCLPGAAVDCGDGLYCNGAESCSPASGCVAGLAPLLDDGVACTADSCNEAADAVTHTPDDSFCDDGNPCTAEACDIVAGCTSSPVATAQCGGGELPPTVPALPPWSRPVLLVLLLASSRAALRRPRA